MKFEKTTKKLKPYFSPEIVEVGDVVKTTLGPYFSGFVVDYYPDGYVYRG